MSFSAKPFLKNILIACVLLTPVAAIATPQPVEALAMTGTPLYPTNFTHFSYTNPDAPKGGILKLGTTGTYDSLNPFIIRGQPPFGLGSGTMSLVYESLMTRGWDEPFTLYGLIAQTVEVADDRSSIIFNLNPAAHFSDGTPITAEDVLFSYETLRDKGRLNHRTYYKKVAVAEKLGPLRVKFTFKPDNKGVIDREMPLIMGLMPVIPKHDWANRDFNQTSLRAPVGSGPYKVSAIDVGRSITYERDPKWWAQTLPAMRGLYNFNKIRIDYYRDDSVSLQAFKAGQYDLRRESDPTKWATAYDFPAAHENRVRLEELGHHRTEPAYGFIFNTRRSPFTDPALRAALEYSFEFNWVNKNLFHGMYKRIDSFFPNSELAAPPLPEGEERDILEKYRGQIPDSVFTDPLTPPEAPDEESFRTELLTAKNMLKEAGYEVVNDQLIGTDGKPVMFEIMLSDPIEEKVALNWAHSLRRLGITATIHTVDSAQYQSRLAGFDFDVTLNKWFNSLSPGNEQMYFWGSAAADQKGSRNYAGVKDPVVDDLAAAIPNARTRADLVAATHALDRVLMSGHYMLPLYYQGADDIASWTSLHHPDKMSLYGNVLEAWWGQ
ncbi:MAG: extracellular solute-binding protein [Alphaproteobacteria bacterium]|nr:extracellular solute-binding protein [Alphaproteobacteria bacterium]